MKLDSLRLDRGRNLSHAISWPILSLMYIFRGIVKGNNTSKDRDRLRFLAVTQQMNGRLALGAE